MLHEQYKEWPVLLSVNHAANLLGVDRKTLAKNKILLEKCTVKVGDKPKVVRDRLLKELKII